MTLLERLVEDGCYRASPPVVCLLTKLNIIPPLEHGDG